jgi:hypothetical protein
MKNPEEKKKSINKELQALTDKDKELREQSALINRQLVAIRDRVNFLSGKLQAIEEDEAEKKETPKKEEKKK